MIPFANFDFFKIFLIQQRSAFQKNFYEAFHYGVKDGVEYGVPMILKTWGEIWGVKIKKFLIIFLVFHQNDVYELQRPPYRVIIVMV